VPGIAAAQPFELQTAQAVVASTPIAAPATKVKRESPIDLDDLGRRLASTKAVGVFTKLSFKGNADRLYHSFRDYHAGKRSTSLAQLRERFDVIIQEVVVTLQRKDPQLAREISAARTFLWEQFSDETKFAAL
jgi:hypothetical protein